MTWSDSIAHQTCSSGTHGVVGHIFHHHPTRKASSDSLPRNWYQVIYIYQVSFGSCVQSRVMPFIWRFTFKGVRMCCNFLSVRIAACQCLSESRGETARSEKPRRRHHGHTVAPNMQPVQNKWLPPGLPPIVQNGYPILSYVYMRLYEYLFVLMYIYFWYLTRSWRLIMPEELTLYLYIYILIHPSS